MKKQAVLDTLSRLPKEFELEDFLEQLIVIEKIDAGLEDVEKGRVISHDRLKKDVKKWLK